MRDHVDIFCLLVLWNHSRLAYMLGRSSLIKPCFGFTRQFQQERRSLKRNHALF